MKRIALLIIFLSLGSQLLKAQTLRHRQTLYWLRYQNQLIFSPDIYWTNEIDNRRFIGPDVQTQLIMHSRLHYRYKQWDFAAGLTHSSAYAAIPENGPRKPIHEIRPVAEVSHELPLGKVFLQQRLRIDNRFFQSDPDQSVLKESDYVLRYRYRIQLRFPIQKNEAGTTILGMRIANEIMFNDEQNTFDQNRIYATWEYYLNRNFSLEAGYIFIDQQRFAREEFFSRHVLRFSLLHKVFVKTKKSVY